ncbi:MAG: TonB-dependent receptor, partial [Gammaproteobacteria bacterium]|nr:TonB-dependent receptor [Gammaproteobacteria bacterium]
DRLDLTLVAGLRYEWFDSSDRPVYNQNFFAASGIRNDANIDGVDLLMPRFGFTWGARDDLTIRGGVGLYSGGNPNVWISNAWSNDGLTNAQFERRDSGGPAQFDDETGTNTFTILPGMADSVTLSGAGRPGYDIPQLLVDDVLGVSPAAANDSALVLIDPDYKQPSEWKFALGGTWEMPWYDVTMDFDVLHSRGNDPAYYVDTAEGIIGTTLAGTPIYGYLDGGVVDNYMLTNSSASPVATTISFVLRKQFDFGLDVLFGYAWTEAEDVAPMTSATAGSNFDNTALLDVNNPPAGNSNWVVPNRFTLRMDYEAQWFGNNSTHITLSGYANEGQPQSYAMQGTSLEGDGFFGRHLLYIPTGPNDPNVVYGPGFDQAAFSDWIARNGLSGGFTERNGFNAGWSTRFDLRISQEIPLGDALSGRVYLKVYNLGNLLNDDWGKITDAEFFTPVIVDRATASDGGPFVYNRFADNAIETTIVESSLWEARIGFDVGFGRK